MWSSFGRDNNSAAYTKLQNSPDCLAIFQSNMSQEIEILIENVSKYKFLLIVLVNISKMFLKKQKEVWN